MDSSSLKTELATKSTKDSVSSTTENQEMANTLSKKKQRKRKRKHAQRDEVTPYLDSDPKDEGVDLKEAGFDVKEEARNAEREERESARDAIVAKDTGTVETTHPISKGNATSSIEKTVNGDIANGGDDFGTDKGGLKPSPASQEADRDGREEKEEQKTAAEVSREAILNGLEKESTSSSSKGTDVECGEKKIGDTSKEVEKEEAKMATVLRETGGEASLSKEVDLNVKEKEEISVSSAANGEIAGKEEEREKGKETARKVSGESTTKKAISREKKRDREETLTVGGDTGDSGTTREKERGVANPSGEVDSKTEKKGVVKEGNHETRDRDTKKKLHSCDHEPREKDTKKKLHSPRDKDAKKKLHSCAWCKQAETEPKTFKRCQR